MLLGREDVNLRARLLARIWLLRSDRDGQREHATKNGVSHRSAPFVTKSIIVETLVTPQKAVRQGRGVRQTQTGAGATPVPQTRRWLLFVHQLPPGPSNVRVRTWRRLQQIGAIVVKQAVYVLPDSPSAREDFEWLKAEIEASGGQASVFAADSVDAWSDDALVEECRGLRQADYERLAREIEGAMRRVPGRRVRGRPLALRRSLEAWRERFGAVERIDFFGSAGRDRVSTLLDRVSERLMEGTPQSMPQGQRRGATPDAYKSRLWVTRPRPGVDRMSSAWLIRRFIDPEASFGFVTDRAAAPRDAMPFDMFGVEFTHRGEQCTFEMLCDVFGIHDSAVLRLAGIVHDLDLKDGRFGAPEAPAIGAAIDGLQLQYADDAALLAQGMVLFESLYRAFEQAVRRVGPRPVARSRTAARTAKKRSR